LNILITGASGFVGSRLISLSKDLFWGSDHLILLTSRQIEGYTCIIHNQYNYTKDDFIRAGVDRIDVVIHIGHFIAQLHPDESVTLGNLSSVNNTMRLIESLPSKPQCFVFCSSMDVYGIHRTELVDESAKPIPENPYAVSKLMIEMYLQEWAGKENVNLHILRLAHIYGPKDKRRYTIPIWLQAGMDESPVRLTTNPKLRRNCLYIDDCCKFLAKACYLEENVPIINLVSDHTAIMLEIAETCIRVSENPSDVLVESNGNNDAGLCFKNSILRQRYLGEEDYTLEEGLKREFEFYKKIREQ
jgi:UDP-glucose 4-epimerase